MADGAWTVDAVLGRLMTPAQAHEIGTIADAESRPGLRGAFATGYARPDEWGPASLEYDRREGRRHIRVTALRLADGVTYTSPTDRSYAVLDETLNRHVPHVVEFEAEIRVAGVIPPETVITALPGRHASAVVDHPALRDPRHLITGAGLDGGNGEISGFSVLIQPLSVELLAARRHS